MNCGCGIAGALQPGSPVHAGPLQLGSTDQSGALQPGSLVQMGCGAEQSGPEIGGIMQLLHSPQPPQLHGDGGQAAQPSVLHC